MRTMLLVSEEPRKFDGFKPRWVPANLETIAML